MTSLEEYQEKLRLAREQRDEAHDHLDEVTQENSRLANRVDELECAETDKNILLAAIGLTPLEFEFYRSKLELSPKEGLKEALARCAG